jgi:hypothetical protein
MWLLYGDETNTDASKDSFYIYGGVAIPVAAAGQIHEEMCNLRGCYGYQRSDALKFCTRKGRPDSVAPQEHTDLKKQVVRLAEVHGVRLFCSLVHHRIARGGADCARETGINQVAASFNMFLQEEKTYGSMSLDRFDRQPELIRKKFSEGLTFPEHSQMLNRVVAIQPAILGASHFCSLADVVLGSLRQAVNNQSTKLGLELVAQLAPLCRRSDGDVDDRSIVLSPTVVRNPRYQQLYADLREFLRKGGVDLG